MNAYTADEMMAVAAARRSGWCASSGSACRARPRTSRARLHAPECVLIYESGTIGAKPVHLPLSIGDGELAETADAVVSVPEIFGYWLQGGRIDVGLGAAQIDRYGNLNSTVIGDYDRPKVRLPGAGGAPEIAAWCRETFVISGTRRGRSWIGSTSARRAAPRQPRHHRPRRAPAGRRRRRARATRLHRAHGRGRAGGDGLELRAAADARGGSPLTADELQALRALRLSHEDTVRA